MEAYETSTCDVDDHPSAPPLALKYAGIVDGDPFDSDQSGMIRLLQRAM
jgi:hypothetical protein